MSIVQVAMGDIGKLGILAGISAILNAAPMGASAQDAAPDSGPIVVEFFTSQSCSSCAVAADYFSELADRDDIVALGWHVDYWNLLNTKHGRWADPYSDTEYTDRQRKYNKNIRKRSSVYTPQIVVAGATEAVGSSREKVDALIRAAYQDFLPVALEAARTEDHLLFDIGKSAEGGNAYLVTFTPYAKTNVAGGENAGAQFSDVNIVTNLRPLGVVRRIGTHITAPAPEDGNSCAIIIQEPQQGRIIAAAYCPGS